MKVSTEKLLTWSENFKIICTTNKGKNHKNAKNMQFLRLGRFLRAVGRLKSVRPSSGPAVSTQKPLAFRAMKGAFFKVPALKLIKGQECGDSRPSPNQADDFNYLVFAVSHPTREPLKEKKHHKCGINCKTESLRQWTCPIINQWCVVDKKENLILCYVTVRIECTSAEEKCIIIYGLKIRLTWQGY